MVPISRIMGMRPKKPKTNPLSREPRIEVGRQIQVAVTYVGGGMEVFGTVRNLSTNGMLFSSPEQFPEESECEFRLICPDNACEVKVTGWVVRAIEGGLAVQFGKLDREIKKQIEQIVARFASTA